MDLTATALHCKSIIASKLCQLQRIIGRHTSTMHVKFTDGAVDRSQETRMLWCNSVREENAFEEEAQMLRRDNAMLVMYISQLLVIFFTSQSYLFT